MVFSNFVGIATQISLLQRWILVHSFIYYEFGECVVNDELFDSNSRQLVSFQNKYSKEAQRSLYWYVFNDFEGSTGFDLVGKLNNEDYEYLYTIASNVLLQHTKRRNKNGY